MANGDLCYKKGGYQLAYSKGSSGSLIYKSSSYIATITLSASISHTTWVCNTYGATHSEAMTLVTGWDSQSYTVTTGTNITIATSYISGKTSLTFTVAVNDPCSAHEDPQVTAILVAQQGSIIKATKVKCPLITTGMKTVTISLSNNILTGIK